MAERAKEPESLDRERRRSAEALSEIGTSNGQPPTATGPKDNTGTRDAGKRRGPVLSGIRRRRLSAPFAASSGEEAEEGGQAMTLSVRSFRPEDAEAVKRICRSHFRSLCAAAVQYYCLQHFRDLVALLVIGKLFHSWWNLGAAALLFLAYLFVRARVELELYIFRECPDLDDIMGFYMADPDGRSHFWVAEVTTTTSSPSESDPSPRGDAPPSPTRNSASQGISAGHATRRSGESQGLVGHPKPRTTVVGCVGCCPTRDDATVVQLLRLVVAADARRMRHGSRLLAQFENFASQKGYRQVRLYTNNLASSHMKFVRQHGYIAIQSVPRTLMRGSLIEWKKTLLPMSSATTIQHRGPSPLDRSLGAPMSSLGGGSGSFRPSGAVSAPPEMTDFPEEGASGNDARTRPSQDTSAMASRRLLLVPDGLQDPPLYSAAGFGGSPLLQGYSPGPGALPSRHRRSLSHQNPPVQD